jgi:hypothetical protein
LEFVNSDTTSKNTHGDNTLDYQAYYQSSAVFGDSLSKELLRRGKNPYSNVEPVEFIANNSDALMIQARDGQIGDKVTVPETVTGINRDFFVNGIEYELSAGPILKVRYILEPVWASGLFILNVSLLNGTDVIYF